MQVLNFYSIFEGSSIAIQGFFKRLKPPIMKFLLYGASGYTGKLILDIVKDHGLEPVLAGRTASKIEALAKEYGFQYTVFDLSDQQAMDKALYEVDLVLNCAGPFKYTAQQMMAGCLRTQTHYIDITGEIEVFEYAVSLNQKAKSAGIMLMPGVGFDVVPTDCLASYLWQKLPDAKNLKLAFVSLGKAGFSIGTASTMVTNLGEGSYVRRNAKLEKVPMGHKTKWVSHEGKKLFLMTLPWGDVSTAYYSTSIPNIETYTGIKPSTYKWIKLQKYFNWILRTSFVKKRALARIRKGPEGPTEAERKATKMLVWGEVMNEKGVKKQGRLITPNGYDLTAVSSLIIAKKILEGNVKTGFQTPSLAFGADLVMEVPGVERKG